MAQAKPGDTVEVHYTGSLLDGEVLDTLTDRKIVQFTMGDGRIIPGFEEAIVGMNPGESKKITVPADKAYGPYRPEMVYVVALDELPGDMKLEVGQQLEIRQGDGRSITARVTDVSQSSVTLDANHTLAGQDLTFDIQLAQIIKPHGSY